MAPRSRGGWWPTRLWVGDLRPRGSLVPQCPSVCWGKGCAGLGPHCFYGCSTGRVRGRTAFLEQPHHFCFPGRWVRYCSFSALPLTRAVRAPSETSSASWLLPHHTSLGLWTAVGHQHPWGHPERDPRIPGVTLSETTASLGCPSVRGGDLYPRQAQCCHWDSHKVPPVDP